jgi:glucose-1-phosphate thymidylyltransferase
MICVVLAAGYATRLYPLTENFPKPLLEVKGKPVLSWLLDDVDTITGISEYVVITNHKFLPHFQVWKEQCGLSHPVTLLDDGSTDNENRLGAVKDIVFALEQRALDDDLLVLAGDNVLEFSFKDFVSFYASVQTTCIMRHWEPRVERLRRTGVVTIDDHSLVLEMEEKPKDPKSNWAVPPFYIYRKADLPNIQKAIESGCNTDAPGSFIAYLSSQTSVHAFEMPGKRYDIGNLESYEQVKRDFQGIFA